MHVFFTEFVTHFGGAPRSTIEFAKRLSQHAEVTIIDPYGCCSEYRAAVAQSGLPYRILMDGHTKTIIGHNRSMVKRSAMALYTAPHLIRLSRLLANLVHDCRESVIISNNAKSLSLAAASVRLRNTPLVGYMRGWYTPDMLPTYARWIYRRRCAALFAVSYATKSALICSGINAQQIHVLQNPIDIESLRRRADDSTCSAPPRAGVSILLPAGLIRGKGQLVAIQALHHLVKAGTDAVMWFAGDLGLGENRSYIEELKRLSQELRVSDRIHWLGMHSNVPKLITACDVVILPSQSEGMPRVVLEAMALRKPVVATPVGGVLDLILPGLNGYLADVDDGLGFARCITSASERLQSERITENAYLFVRSQFSTERHTEKALKILRRLVTRRNHI